MAAAPALATPLLAGGPVGWALYAVVVVGSAAVTAYAIHKATEQAERTFPDSHPSPVQPCPRATSEVPEPTPKPPQPDPKPPPRPIPPYMPRWEPTGDENHPTKDEIEDALNDSGEDCGSIGQSIAALVKNLRFRRWDYQLPRTNNPTKQTHRDRYKKEQDALKRLVAIARVKGCLYDPEADVEISRDISFPTRYF